MVCHLFTSQSVYLSIKVSLSHKVSTIHSSILSVILFIVAYEQMDQLFLLFEYHKISKTSPTNPICLISSVVGL